MSSVPRASKAASSQPAGMAAIAFLFAIALIILGSLVGSGPLPVDLSIREALRVGSPVRCERSDGPGAGDGDLLPARKASHR